jgi:hypothetical protein
MYRIMIGFCLLLVAANCSTITDGLNGCYLTIPENTGEYETKQIPDLTINVGDTLWISQKEYFKGTDKCDAGYGSFEFNFFKMDYERANIIQSDLNFGVVGVMEGKSTIEFSGSYFVRRNDISVDETITGAFNINVVKNGAVEQDEPEDLLTPFSLIKDASVKKKERANNIYIELNIDFENGYFDREHVNTSFFVNNTDSEDLMNYERKSTLGYESRGAEVRWDSLTTEKYVRLWRTNHATWNPETETHDENYSSKVRHFLKIESFPIDKPVAEREFRVTGF